MRRTRGADRSRSNQNSPTSRKLIALVELIPRLKMASTDTPAVCYFEEDRYRLETVNRLLLDIRSV